MDKARIISILAAYSPPLSSGQMEAIAEEIAKISAEEVTKITEVRGRKK